MKMKCTFYESAVAVTDDRLDVSVLYILDLVSSKTSEAKKTAKDFALRDAKEFVAKDAYVVGTHKFTNVVVDSTDEDTIIKELKNHVSKEGYADVDFVIVGKDVEEGEQDADVKE